MNARVLELIKRPEIISKEDISVLQSEIDKFPYMQSIRTLYLSAIYQFDAENYQKELSKTAAYTTDKKILYQFINFKKEIDKKEPVKFKKINLVKDAESHNSALLEEEKTNEATNALIINNPEIQIEIADTEVEAPIIEKKENEFEVLQSEIDVELESQIFAELAAQEEKEKEVFRTRDEDLNYSKETVLEHIDQIKETNITPAEISFNAFDSFLPDVKFSIPTKKEEPLEYETPIIFTQEKPLETILPKEKNTDQPQKNIITPEPFLPQNNSNPEIEQPNNSEEKEELVIVNQEPEPEIISDWKPMSFAQNPLDANIKISELKKPIVAEPILVKTITPIAKPVEITPIEELKPEETIQEVDFKQNDEQSLQSSANLNLEIGKLNVQNSNNEEQTSDVNLEKTSNDAPSNIPNFVNTWQNWLKIDRKEQPKSEESQPEKIIEKKSEIIDKFIEENPKISQFKEDANYIVKEKADDISHLITETLAKLYTTQKLYTKAIKAYEILQQKHPEKLDFFEAKILEIKELKK